jgi:hypothetical protein
MGGMLDDFDFSNIEARLTPRNSNEGLSDKQIASLHPRVRTATEKIAIGRWYKSQREKAKSSVGQTSNRRFNPNAPSQGSGGLSGGYHG